MRGGFGFWEMGGWMDTLSVHAPYQEWDAYFLYSPFSTLRGLDSYGYKRKTYCCVRPSIYVLGKHASGAVHLQLQEYLQSTRFTMISVTASCLFLYPDTYIHTYTQSYTHTYTHTYMHTYEMTHCKFQHKSQPSSHDTSSTFYMPTPKSPTWIWPSVLPYLPTYLPTYLPSKSHHF